MSVDDPEAAHRVEARAPIAGRQVGDYFRLERWEVPPPPGAEGPSSFGGRVPVDRHQRGPGGGLRTGGLVTVFDSLGGFLSGLAVHPEWIVTTSMVVAVARLEHRGPLGLEGRILRQGRSSVVAGLEAVDEGAGGVPVAVATMTCTVLDPGSLALDFDRPFSAPMPPPEPDAPPPESFFCIQPGTGPVVSLELADSLRNPWGFLHGGAVAVLADVAACRTVTAAVPGQRGSSEAGNGTWTRPAAADTVLHYLRPAKVGPVEARGDLLGLDTDRAVVALTVHDVGADDRVVAVGSVEVRPT